MIEFAECKCIKCVHFPCLKVQCSAENTEVCYLYETEVSRAIKKLREEGYYDFERRKVGGNMKECKFIRQNDDWIVYECSNCKDLWTFEDGTPADNNYNYCANCGAKITEVIELEEEE